MTRIYTSDSHFLQQPSRKTSIVAYQRSTPIPFIPNNFTLSHFLFLEHIVIRFWRRVYHNSSQRLLSIPPVLTCPESGLMYDLGPFSACIC